MTHRNWKTVLLLAGIVGMLVFTRSLFGDENERIHRSDSNKTIAKKLKTPNVPHYKDVPMGEVIKDLAKKADLKITIDPKAFEEEGLTEETPVTLDIKHEIMVKSCLLLILDPMHLWYEIRGDQVVIVSGAQFEARIVKWEYNVAEVANSPAEKKKLLAAIRSIVKQDAPEGTFREENIVVSNDGMIVAVEQARCVQSKIAEFIADLRRAGGQKERELFYEGKGWVTLDCWHKSDENIPYFVR